MFEFDWTLEIISLAVTVVVIIIVELALEKRRRKQWEERRRVFIQGYKYAKQETEERKETKQKE
jgi:hypothetical protein